MTSSMRVAVLGGGILGVSTAAALAKQGADVTLMTAGELASGASGRSLAWLNSFGMRSPEYHYLRLLGLDRYRTLAARTGSSAFLRFDGGLNWASDGSVADHRAAFEHMRDIGYACEWLTPEEVSARTPGVDPAAISAAGAIFNPQEGWVDLPGLIEHLAATVVANGGTIRTGTGHSDIVLTAGRVTAVRSGDGAETRIDAAVLATGADVPHILKALDIVIPDATPIALLVRTPPIGTSLRAVLNTPRVAVRPTPDGALAMDSGWSEREVVVQPDGSHEARDETIQGLLEEASNVLEGHPRLTCASYGVGPKPIPGDGEPVLGGLEAIPGYYVAFTHSGATLGLIAGELLADEILNTRAHPLLDPYRPSRFALTTAVEGRGC